MTPQRLHLGCGNDIVEGWLNHDALPLPGVDVVHDLNVFPWPFETGSITEIRAFHVLEHLPDTVRVMEEMHRILASGGRITLRVPYWNSPDMVTDPTHQRAFHQRTLDFFDPDRPACRERPYYSKARFHIARVDYYVRLGRYWRIGWGPAKAFLSWLATYLCGIIWVLEFDLESRPSP